MYDTSVYEVYSPLFWFLYIFSGLCGITRVIIDIFLIREKYRWLWGTFLLIGLTTFVLSFPIFCDYVEFLNRNTPKNSRVILPSFGRDSKILVNPYMHFSLVPRKGIICVNPECHQAISREDTFIVDAGNLIVNLAHPFSAPG